MNEKNVVGDEVTGDIERVELIDLGDAMAETKQPHAIQQVKDSVFTLTYVGFE